MTEPTAHFAREVCAFNDARDSGNPVHEDATARALGYKGALVPGVTVYGYATHGVVAHFGAAWLDRGSMAVSFLRPVYDGEATRIEYTVEQGACGAEHVRIRVQNPEGATCMAGVAALTQDIVPALPLAPPAPARALPKTKWPATRERFASERVLGTLATQFTAAAQDALLAVLHDDHACYRDGAVHPAWLLRQANLVVDRNVALGPWVHVGSELHNHSRVAIDETIELRTQVISLYERKGRDYVDLDVAVVVPGTPERLAMRILHRAIYDMHGT